MIGLYSDSLSSICSTQICGIVHASSSFSLPTPKLLFPWHAVRVLSSGGGGGGGGSFPPNVPAPKRFFLNSQCTDTFSLEVKLKTQSAFHMKWVYYISPCTLCKTFALRVGPSHTYLKLPPPPPPPPHPKRNFLDRTLAVVHSSSLPYSTSYTLNTFFGGGGGGGGGDVQLWYILLKSPHS